MADLHPKQKIILKLLKKNIDNPLSMVDISYEAEISSPGVFYHHLHQLEKKGYIKLNPENPRDYVIMAEPEKAIVYINKYGTAQCGPNGSILEGKPIERLPIPSFLLKFPAIEAFIVEAKGNSMEPKIHSGDTLIAKKQKHADHGDIIVCVLNEKVLVKQYLLVQKKQVLYSLNEEYKLIEIKGDFHIEGIVKNILH